ncbi:MAG: hypothetical protein V4666_12300 [Bacteroidota bacterium]
MKKTFYSIILLLFIFSSCEKKIEIPENSKVIAKYVVFEDSISRKIIKNLDSVEPFDKKNDDYKLPFKLDEKIYQFETEFRLSDGRLTRLNEHEYHTFQYSNFGLKKININRETIGTETLIEFSKSREKIIDSKDTIEIENIYPKEKLIFVKRDDGRVNVYEYK